MFDSLPGLQLKQTTGRLDESIEMTRCAWFLPDSLPHALSIRSDLGRRQIAVHQGDDRLAAWRSAPDCLSSDWLTYERSRIARWRVALGCIFGNLCP